MHSIVRTQRSSHSCPRRVNAGNKNTQHAQSTKTECDYLYEWIKTVIYGKISPKMVNPRDMVGNIEEKYKKKYKNCISEFVGPEEP